MTAMKAAVYRRFGPAGDVLAIETLPVPAPAEGEVLVRLHASGVNPSDVKARAGLTAAAMPFPAIVPHNDGAGVVAAVGPGVDRGRIGRRVWVWNAQFRRPAGTAAEYVALPAVQAVPLPDAVSFREAACLGVPALTAHRAVTCGSPVAGRTVLVAGGLGAVGRYAVRMAKLEGAAHVIATIGDTARAAEAREAGADTVLGHGDPDLPDRIRAATGGRGVDRILEVEWGLNHATDLAVIRPEGEIHVFGSARLMEPAVNVQRLMMTGVTLHFRSVFLLPDEVRRAAVERLTHWLENGMLDHRVGAAFPLDRIAEAHEAVESAAVPGRVVVDLP